MKDSLPADVDPNFTNIIYACKMAVTEMHAGNVAFAERYMDEAFTQCDGCHQTFVKAFLFHDLQFVSRILHSSSPADKHLKDTISRGDLGLLFMTEECDTSAQIWNRIFLTENAMGLLKIRSNFKVLVNESVDRSDLEHAEQLLSRLQPLDSLELRREMIYHLCQARVCELKGNIENAIKFAFNAKDLAKEGVHFENDKTNIDEYYEYLCRKGEKRY
jgi:hypothetical protein